MSLRINSEAPNFTAETTQRRVGFCESIGDEVSRLLPFLRSTARGPVATLVAWKAGEGVILAPSLSDSETKRKFPAGWKALRPHLRVMAQPR